MRILYLILLFIFSGSQLAAQGKYAGTKKSMIGITFQVTDTLKALRGWIFMEGSVITPYDDPETIIVSAYRKGTTWVVVAGYCEDTASNRYVVADVLEVKAVMTGWQIRTGACRRDEQENSEVLALVKKSVTQELLKPAKKAWRFNRDKRRFEIIPVARIDCFNEAMD